MKFYKTDWFLRVASLVAAIFIWLYVVYQENPTIDTWVNNIYVAQRNLSQDFENGKLVILSVSSNDVDVKLSGRRSIISSINAESGSAYIDMSKITEAGRYEVPIKVDFSIDGMDVVQLKPNRCTVVVDRVVTEERPITIIRKGVVSGGHFVEDIVMNPDVLKISGPKTAVDAVASCSITVDLTDKSEDIKGLYKIKLYDESGAEITDSSVTKNIEYTDVHCMLSTVKNVLVKPVLSATENSKGEKIVASCEPARLTVSGKAALLESTEELLTNAIDVSKVYEETEIECEVLLPDGLVLADENITTVKVKLTVSKENEQ